MTGLRIPVESLNAEAIYIFSQNISNTCQPVVHVQKRQWLHSITSVYVTPQLLGDMQGAFVALVSRNPFRNRSAGTRCVISASPSSSNLIADPVSRLPRDFCLQPDRPGKKNKLFSMHGAPDCLASLRKARELYFPPRACAVRAPLVVRALAARCAEAILNFPFFKTAG